MTWEERVILKDGRELLIRNGEEKDAAEVLYNFNTTHSESDFLYTYPDENSFTEESERNFLKEKEEAENEIELVAIVDGKIVGTAGFESLGQKFKTKHRCDYGISVLKDYWGLGIGRELTKASVECAKKAGYVQMELNVVGENERAISLYRSFGFTEYGRNPKGFKSRLTGNYQELVYMRLEL